MVFPQKGTLLHGRFTFVVTLGASNKRMGKTDMSEHAISYLSSNLLGDRLTRFNSTQLHIT